MYSGIICCSILHNTGACRHDSCLQGSLFVWFPSKLWQQLSASRLQATDNARRTVWAQLISCSVEQRLVYQTHSLSGRVPCILAIPLILSFSNEQSDWRNTWKNFGGQVICYGLSQSKNLVQGPQNGGSAFSSLSTPLPATGFSAVSLILRWAEPTH